MTLIYTISFRDLTHVSLAQATSSHLIAYDVERDLMPLILAQCNYSLEVGKGTVVEYNWAGLERQLIDRFIRGRPLIDYQVSFLSLAFGKSLFIQYKIICICSLIHTLS